MPLREEFEQQGNWLFRWRSYLPLLLAPLFLLAVVNYRPLGDDPALDRGWWLACLGLSFAGLWLRCLTVGRAPRGTSGRNTFGQVAEQLNTTGIYSVVRHPLYLANFIIWLGPVLALRQAWFVLTVCLLYWLYYERIMFAEEEFLRRKFGEAYVAWASRTPAFLPRPRRWRPAELPFSLKTVLKREYSGFFGIIATFVGLQFMLRLVFHRDLRVEPFWLALFVVGLVTHLTLLTLKKATNVLYVEGR